MKLVPEAKAAQSQTAINEIRQTLDGRRFPDKRLSYSGLGGIWQQLNRFRDFEEVHHIVISSQHRYLDWFDSIDPALLPLTSESGK